ncbi:MAG: cyanophycin synthetase [Ligilactobacillus agilis]|nr:cyanophycin synthetase [Ligilactobacillus agilis]
MSEITLTYEKIVASLNPQMKGGEDDRVALLNRVLTNLNHPDQKFKIIHIAGTNGKGSTGKLIAQFLQATGEKVGHFNSPVMVDQREQIQVNGQLISKHDFVATYQKIKEQLPSDISPHDLTVFEWWTVIMLQYFADQDVNWAVIECGIGGQNDATNAIKAPELAVITHVALDHVKIIGPDLKAIATAKAGIIKSPTKAVILAPHQASVVSQVMKYTAAQKQVPLINAESVEINVHETDFKGQTIRFQSNAFSGTSHFNLLGTFQIDNLKTALTVADWLVRNGVNLTQHQIKQVITTIQIPGRMQLIGTDPQQFLDGAHNPDATKRLIQTLNQLSPSKKLVLVLGFLKDKNVAQMAQMYQALAAEIIITTPDYPARALSANELKVFLPQATVIEDVNIAFKKAKQIAGKDGLVVVTGSFYVIKEIEAKVK